MGPQIWSPILMVTGKLILDANHQNQVFTGNFDLIVVFSFVQGCAQNVAK